MGRSPREQKVRSSSCLSKLAVNVDRGTGNKNASQARKVEREVGKVPTGHGYETSSHALVDALNITKHRIVLSGLLIHWIRAPHHHVIPIS